MSFIIDNFPPEVVKNADRPYLEDIMCFSSVRLLKLIRKLRFDNISNLRDLKKAKKYNNRIIQKYYNYET